MKFIKTLLVLFSLSANAGLPPTSLVGRDSAEKNGFFPLSVPNAQSTRITGGALIETGNENILANPSFESNRSTTGYGWSVSGATASLDTTNQIHGKNALSLSLSSTLNLNQSAATNVANTVGLQAMASIYVKSSLADVNVCSIINNVEDKCVQYNGTNTWVKIEIPFIFGATQNGIKIKTTSSTSGTVLVDNAFVGLSSPFQNTSNVGPWIAYTPTFTGFGTVASQNIKYRINGSNVDIQGTFTAGTTTAVEFRMSLPNSYTSPSDLPTLSHVGTLLSGSTNANNSGLAVLIEPSVSYVTFGVVSTANAAITKTSATAQIQTGATFSINASVPVSGLANSSKIYSQASQDYAYTNAGTITIGATTTSPTKGTVVTDRVMASRKGQNLRARYQYEQSTAGTAGSGDYLFTLPSGLSFDSNIINFYTGTNIAGGNPKSIVGYGRMADGTTESYIATLMAYDATRFRVIVGYGAGNAKFATNALWAFSNTSMGFDFELDAPISGWQDYGVIVGSFQYVPQVPGQSNVDIFSVSYGTTNATTVCSASPCSYLSQTGNAISSITRSGTGSYSFNFSKTYLAINCSASLNASAGITGTQGLLSGYTWSCKNCNSLSVTTGIANSSAYDTYGTLFCTGSY